MFAGKPDPFGGTLALGRGKIGYLFPCDDRLRENGAKELKIG